ncbi:hypothetical protein BGZ93_003817, partial [Podila epicladia]
MASRREWIQLSNEGALALSKHSAALSANGNFFATYKSGRVLPYHYNIPNNRGVPPPCRVATQTKQKCLMSRIPA